MVSTSGLSMNLVENGVIVEILTFEPNLVHGAENWMIFFREIDMYTDL